MRDIISRLKARRYRDSLNQADDNTVVAVFANLFLTYIVFQAIVILVNTNFLSKMLFGDFYKSLEYINVGVGGRDPSKTIFLYPLPEWLLFVILIIILSSAFSFFLSKYYIVSFKKVVIYSNLFFITLFSFLTLLSTIAFYGLS